MTSFERERRVLARALFREGSAYAETQTELRVGEKTTDAGRGLAHKVVLDASTAWHSGNRRIEAG